MRGTTRNPYTIESHDLGGIYKLENFYSKNYIYMT